MRKLLLGILITLAAGTAWAAAPPDKIHLEIAGVELPSDVPAEAGDLEAKVRTTLADLIAKRPDLSATLDGAPDPSNAVAFRAFLAKKHLRAFTVTVKVTAFSRSVGPNPNGKHGQVLTDKISVSLVGGAMPDGELGLSGEGRASIIAEIGAAPTPSDEASTADDLVREALTQALDDAATKVKAKPPAKSGSAKKPGKPAKPQKSNLPLRQPAY